MSFRAPLLREESAPLLSMNTYFVYIISNKSRRLYIGVTSNLPIRILQHKYKAFPDSFTARYNFDVLVYFERDYDPNHAIARQTEIKKWRREKKLKLIAELNPLWADLSAEWREDEGWRALPEENIDRGCAHVSAQHSSSGADSSPALRDRNDIFQRAIKNAPRLCLQI